MLSSLHDWLPLMSNVDEISSRLLKNSLVMIAARAGSVLTLLLCVPVIVSCLGPEGYGVWESLMAVAGMAMLFQSVVSGMVLWRISMSYGAQDPVETRRLIQIGVSATLSLMLLFLPLIYAFRIEIAEGLQISNQQVQQARWLLPSIVAIMLLGGINESLAAVITGYQKAGLASLIQSLGLAGSNLVCVCLLYLNGGLLSLLIGYVTGFVVMFAILYPLASSMCGRISLLPRLPERRDIAVAGPFMSLLLLSNLSLVLRDHTDKIVLASLVSPITVGYFGIAQRLTALLMQVCTVILGPFVAAVGMLQARGDWLGVKKLYLNIGTWSAVVSGVTAVVICGLHKHIMFLWLGMTPPEATWFLAVLMFGGTSVALFSGIGSSLCRGIGRSGPEAVYTSLALLLNIVLKYVFVYSIGAQGTVVASAVSWCIGSVFFLLLTHYLMDLPAQLIWRLFLISFVTFVIATTGWLLEEYCPPPTGRIESACLIFLLGPVIAGIYLLVLFALRILPVDQVRPRIIALWGRIQGFRLREVHA